MSIEDQVADALDEFEEMVAGGESVASAASIAANNNLLKDATLLKRAADRFGDLSSLAERLTKEKAAASRAARIRQEVFAYTSTFFGAGIAPEFCDVVEWVEERLGFELTPDEASYAVGQMNIVDQQSMNRDLTNILATSRMSNAPNP